MFSCRGGMRDISGSSKMSCHAFELFIVNIQVNILQSSPRRFSFRSFLSCYYLQGYVCNHAGSEQTDSSLPLVALRFLQFY